MEVHDEDTGLTSLNSKIHFEVEGSHLPPPGSTEPPGK